MVAIQKKSKQYFSFDAIMNSSSNNRNGFHRKAQEVHCLVPEETCTERHGLLWFMFFKGVIVALILERLIIH
ncbi:hypothetical protein PMIT1320_00391 [Prochlorococcus marinus str. MIT 1320]|nr:hypothetical protein PMIT1320_00391 [Prochlorococcus marinus str. MIT 1320]